MNMLGPVLKVCKTLADVIANMNNLRVYFSAVPGVGNLTVVQPPNGATLNIGDGEALIVNNTWDLRSVHGGLSGLALDTTKYVEVRVKGITVKLAVLK